MEATNGLRRFVAPAWANSCSFLTANRPAWLLPGIAHLPTPVVRMQLPARLLPAEFRLWIKRDDVTGCELSGNKVRKLQFLLADAKLKGADCIVTAGGEQSNHARATALAARAVGLEPHLVLRTDASPENLGVAGNLLLNRLAGAKLYVASKREWGISGGDRLIAGVADALKSNGRNPYIVPVGGSNGLGTWGYLDGVRELEEQLLSGEDLPSEFSDVVVTTGSGGTTGGLALGIHLSSLNSRVHAFSVCMTPEYFYDFIDRYVIADLANTAAGNESNTSLPHALDLVRIRNVAGRGYAKSTPEELDIIRDVAQCTGLVLDPVYSGKGFAGFLKEARENPSCFKGRDILFWHTGGIYGIFDKAPEFTQLFDAADVQRIADVAM